MTSPSTRSGDTWQREVGEVYDDYHGSGLYARRYPEPNPGTMRFLWRHGVGRARAVLDVGCGTGRYALPVLAGSGARLVGCDISRAAIEVTGRRLAEAGLRARADLWVGGVDAVPAGERFDSILLLFGVLGYAGAQQARLELLRALRGRLAPGGRLLLSVPNVWRREPAAVLAALWEGAGPGDIACVRWIRGQRRTLPYHLYTLGRLRRELAQSGWVVESVEAESVLPERWVSKGGWLARLDGGLQRLWPAVLGYGLRVAARPAGESR